MSVVDQDIVTFSDTVYDNVTLWDSSVEDFEVILACRDAAIHQEIVTRMLDLLAPILETVPEADEDKPSVESIDGSIEVSGVTFSYGDNSPIILRDLTFRVRSGEYVALVGKSGCGKSTILRLLLGFETPDSGSIYYGPHNVQDVDLRSLRQQIGTVLQDGKLFMGDMASNITLSTPDALNRHRRWTCDTSSCHAPPPSPPS